MGLFADLEDFGVVSCMLLGVDLIERLLCDLDNRLLNFLVIVTSDVSAISRGITVSEIFAFEADCGKSLAVAITSSSPDMKFSFSNGAEQGDFLFVFISGRKLCKSTTDLLLQLFSVRITALSTESVSFIISVLNPFNLVSSLSDSMLLIERLSIFVSDTSSIASLVSAELIETFL